MNGDFEDIEIVDLDVAKTTWSDFVTKRHDWQARFRAALALRKKEPARGND